MNSAAVSRASTDDESLFAGAGQPAWRGAAPVAGVNLIARVGSRRRQALLRGQPLAASDHAESLVANLLARRQTFEIGLGLGVGLLMRSMIAVERDGDPGIGGVGRKGGQLSVEFMRLARAHAGSGENKNAAAPCSQHSSDKVCAP